MAIENATTLLTTFVNAENGWQNQSAGGGFPADTFTIVSYEARNIYEETHSGGKIVNTRQLNRAPIPVLTTSIEGVLVWTSSFKKFKIQVSDNSIIYHGGEVFDAWRKVSRAGLTKEQYCQELLKVTQDAKGKQRPLKARYEEPVMVYTGRTDENGQKTTMPFENLCIDFAD